MQMFQASLGVIIIHALPLKFAHVCHIITNWRIDENAWKSH